MTHINYAERGQPDGEHRNTHPGDHFYQLVHTTPLNTTRPEPRYTHHQRARAELRASPRKTIAQRARIQHPYLNNIPNRYYRHSVRSCHRVGVSAHV